MNAAPAVIALILSSKKKVEDLKRSSFPSKWKLTMKVNFFSIHLLTSSERKLLLSIQLHAARPRFLRRRLQLGSLPTFLFSSRIRRNVDDFEHVNLCCRRTRDVFILEWEMCAGASWILMISWGYYKTLLKELLFIFSNILRPNMNYLNLYGYLQQWFSTFHGCAGKLLSRVDSLINSQHKIPFEHLVRLRKSSIMQFYSSATFLFSTFLSIYASIIPTAIRSRSQLSKCFIS